MNQETSVSEVQAIDVHGHYGVYFRGVSQLVDRFMTGDASVIVSRASQSNIGWSIVSPLLALLPRFKADAVAGNKEAIRVVTQTKSLLQWVVVNPLQPETYEQANEMLKMAQCVGIKIHPEEHGYPITEHGREILEFAAGLNVIVLTHSGEQNSLPMDFVPFANDFPEVQVILAHLGCGWDNDPSHQVMAIQASHRGNVYVDTSSASSIMSGLLEWAVKEVGAEQILFGTDTPLYSTAMQRARIDKAEISADAKRKILRENAVKLFKLNFA